MIIMERGSAETVLLQGESNHTLAEIVFVDGICAAIICMPDPKAYAIIHKRVGELKDRYQIYGLGDGLALVRKHNWNCVRRDLPTIIAGWLKG